jgi:23S rRNA (adenine2503-C2)-methyltransferase
VQKTKFDLKNLTVKELETLVQNMGEQKFRGEQIFSWIHKGIDIVDQMSNIPKELREKLNKNTYIGCLRIEKTLISKMDGTRKYLFLLEDDNIVESVLMKYTYGNSVCVSSQVGCRMGCRFCASTLGGIIRNLTAGEILDQVLMIQKDIGERVSNIVLMGSGEPLDNYIEILRFLEIINHPIGLNISLRNITLSTCGLVPQILDLADKRLQITLAVSLHAPNDTLRDQIMPINHKYPLNRLLKACKTYADKTKRRITFEYALIHNFNDEEIYAYELSNRIKGILCHVNLIPLNPINERNLRGSRQEKARRFQKILRENGIEATIRRELGSDIDAACGQLRRRYLKTKEKPSIRN